MVSLHNYIKTSFLLPHSICWFYVTAAQLSCRDVALWWINCKVMPGHHYCKSHHFTKLISFGSASIFSYEIAERISLFLSWCRRGCLQEICSIPRSFSLTIAIYQRGINLQAPQGAWCYACSLSLSEFRYKGRCKQIWVGWERYKWEDEPLYEIRVTSNTGILTNSVGLLCTNTNAFTTSGMFIRARWKQSRQIQGTFTRRKRTRSK